MTCKKPTMQQATTYTSSGVKSTKRASQCPSKPQYGNNNPVGDVTPPKPSPRTIY